MSEEELKKRLDKLQTELVSLQENFKNFRALIGIIYLTIIAPLLLIVFERNI